MLACKDRFTAGMPNLDIFGLSEHFCLTHAGNLHWNWIASLTGKRPTEWVTQDGHRIYASFVYTSLTYNRVVDVSEDDDILVDCVPQALRPPFFITETTYTKAGKGQVAVARMMSTLSTILGPSNSRFGKTSMAFQSEPFGETQLDETRMRFRQLRSHDDTDLLDTNEHLVNPALDFNAAQFMYFANFSQLFKRYEYPEISAKTPLVSREIAYFGNVDAFEWTNIASARNAKHVTSAMTRASDQKCIARSLSVLGDQPVPEQVKQVVSYAAPLPAVLPAE